jgi:hypothetical protein
MVIVPISDDELARNESILPKTPGNCKNASGSPSEAGRQAVAVHHDSPTTKTASLLGEERRGLVVLPVRNQGR